jgi:hypothetical protein
MAITEIIAKNLKRFYSEPNFKNNDGVFKIGLFNSNKIIVLKIGET